MSQTYKIKALVLMLLVIGIESKKKHKPHQQKSQQQAAKLGQHHTFSLSKYQKPQQFSFQVSCQQKAYLNFELSKRLKTLHRHLYLDVDFETDDCIETHQDQNRVIVNDQSWDLELENVCCSAKNKTKVFNQTIKVIVRDGFKVFGVAVKTKTWNTVMPIFISFLISLFVWFSNFAQPRADNVSFLSRFYKQKPKLDSSKHLDISIDKDEQNNLTSKQPEQATKAKQK